MNRRTVINILRVFIEDVENYRNYFPLKRLGELKNYLYKLCTTSQIDSTNKNLTFYDRVDLIIALTNAFYDNLNANPLIDYFDNNVIFACNKFREAGLLSVANVSKFMAFPKQYWQENADILQILQREGLLNQEMFDLFFSTANKKLCMFYTSRPAEDTDYNPCLALFNLYLQFKHNISLDKYKLLANSPRSTIMALKMAAFLGADCFHPIVLPAVTKSIEHCYMLVNPLDFLSKNFSTMKYALYPMYVNKQKSHLFFHMAGEILHQTALYLVKPNSMNKRAIAYTMQRSLEMDKSGQEKNSLTS